MKFKFIYLIAIFSMTLVSCDKYLEVDSPSKFTDTYVFDRVDDAQKAVLSIYARFNQDGYTSRISTNQAGNTDMECGGVSAAPDGARRDIWSFEANDANSEVKKAWDNAFIALNRANECIEGIRNSSLYQSGDADMQQLLGEALALRAFWDHLLVVYWGDIPFKTTPTKAGDEFYIPRTNRDTILSTVIQDLIDIEPHMKYASQLPEGIERINREFVQGLIARIALCRGGYYLGQDGTMQRAGDYLKYYEIANTYAKKMVASATHVLSSDFLQIFKDECQYIVNQGEDVLYEVAFYPGSGDVAWNNGIRVDGGDHPYGSGSNYMSFPPTYYLSFDSLDTRLPATCAFYKYDENLIQQPQSWSSIAPGKWCRAWMTSPTGSSTAKGTGINWPIMRYSDVLLMLAESENELNGPDAIAQDALKQVRQRAFPEDTWSEKVDAYLAKVSESKESFLNAIVDERAWEFGGEMMRKFDLIRWNIYGKKISGVRNTLNQMAYDIYNESGEYADAPAYLYYKRANDQFETITFYDIWKKPVVEPPLFDELDPEGTKDNFYRYTWLKSLYDEKLQGPSEYMQRQWRGYTDDSGNAPVPYILPIPRETVLSSQGVLDNNGWLLERFN